MKLQDESGGRAIELRPVAWHARTEGGGTDRRGADGRGADGSGADEGGTDGRAPDDAQDARVVIEAIVEDEGRSWTLSDPCLTSGEVRDLAAWLAGLAEDTTAGADEWASLTFGSDALSMSGHRIPGGTVELRIALLRMRAGGPGTTDVVVGLRAPQAAVTAAARDLVRELADLP